MRNRGPAILLGGGGHAKVLADLLALSRCRLLGYVDPEPAGLRIYGRKLKYLGTDEAIGRYRPERIRLVNGVGGVRPTGQRKKLFMSFKNKGYFFMTVQHPGAIISADVLLGEGAQVMAGAVIQAGSVIGDDSIINTAASVDHDCRIGAHVHVAPGAVICGGVRVGEGSHIGAGAVVVQGAVIAAGSFIKAGSLVKAK